MANNETFEIGVDENHTVQRCSQLISFTTDRSNSPFVASQESPDELLQEYIGREFAGFWAVSSEDGEGFHRLGALFAS
jgi:hypothetical protein